LLLFTDERAELEVEQAPVPALTPKKLKDFIRKTAKTAPLSLNRVKQIQEVFAK
jgi:hypothetical protein